MFTDRLSGRQTEVIGQQRPSKKKAGRTLVLWGLTLGVWVVSVVLAWMFLAPSSREVLALHGAIYDRGMTVFAKGQAKAGGAGEVAVVAIKESTYRDLKGVPSFVPGVPGTLSYNEQPRAFHARLLQNLKKLGAKTVVFDMLFYDENPKLDPYLSKAIQEHGNVVLAATEETTQEAAGQAVQRTQQYPNPLIRTGAKGYGFANVPLDSDKTVRQFQWWYHGIDEDTAEDTDFPALGVAAAAAFKDKDPKALIKDEVIAKQTFLGVPIVGEKNASKALVSNFRYYGTAGSPAGADSVINYENLVRSGQDEAVLSKLRQQVQGKIVFVGDETTVGQDIKRAPVISEMPDFDDPTQSTSSQQMPGVQIQAHVAQAVLKGGYVSKAPLLLNLLMVLVVTLAIAVAGRLLPPLPTLGIAIVLIAAVLFGTQQLLVGASGMFLEPVTASAGVGISMVLELGLMYVFERRQKAAVSRQLSRHVGPGVATQLADDEWPEMQGETREITMLFSDLQGFTSISETMTSAEICTLLNRYFGVIFPVLDKWGGSLDKLMGDGMMAYFGWPARHPNHAERAIMCAIEMQQALAEWQRQPDNAGLPPLKTRVGVHTGSATIGEIGAEGRVEFTVIGDVVNVASRLEGMNKDFGTNILISQSSRDHAGEVAPMVPRGVATVRGRKEPMPVYSVEAATSVTRQRTPTRTQASQRMARRPPMSADGPDESGSATPE